MDDLLRYGVEELDGVLRVNSTTKAAFKSLVNVMEEVSGFIEEQNKGVISSLLRKHSVPDLVSFLIIVSR